MKDSQTDKILYTIASVAAKFYSESTREWTKRTVRNLEGNKVKNISRKEAEDMDSIPDGALVFRTRDDEDDDILKVFDGDERKRGLTAMVLAIKHRLKQYWTILLIPIILYLIDSSSISLSSAGLYFNLFGAIITVRGLYRTPTEIDYQSMLIAPKDPVNDTGNPLGSPEDRLISAVETVDSMFGSLLLALGFSLQLLANSGILLTIAVLLLVVIIWLGLR